MNEPLSQTWV